MPQTVPNASNTTEDWVSRISKEIQQGGKPSLAVQAPSISIGNNKKFTYDTVFDSGVDQETMYSAVAGSLLDSFVEGYNATVSTYGSSM